MEFYYYNLEYVIYFLAPPPILKSENKSEFLPFLSLSFTSLRDLC